MQPSTVHSTHGRHYVLNCIKGEAATPCTFDVWAWGVLEACDKAKAAGYWPLSVHSSSWSETNQT